MSLRERVEELEREIEKLEDKYKNLEQELKNHKKSEEEKTIVNNNFYNEYIQAILYLSKFSFENIKMYELREKVKNTTLQTIINKDYKQEHFSRDIMMNYYGFGNEPARRSYKIKKLARKNIYSEIKLYNGLRKDDYEFIVYDGDEKLYEALTHIQDLPKSIVFSIYKFLEEILEEDAELLQYK